MYALLSPSLPADVLYVLARLATVAAIVVGVRRHQPHDPAAWWALAAGVAAFTTGTVVFGVSGMLGDGAPPFPSPADLCYLAAYVLWVVGLGRFARARRRRDAKGVLDATIIALAAAVLAWAFLVQPYAADRSIPLAERLVAVAYPVADVVVLGVAVRLAFGPGRPPPALRLLGGGLALLLLGDLGYTVQRMTDSFETGNVLSLAWYAFFALWGMAALHPSMTALTQPAPVASSGLSLQRMVAVTAGVIAIPAVTAVQRLRDVQPDAVVLAVGWLLVAALGVLRVLGLVRELEQTLQSLRRVSRRERVLRDAGTRLVAAASSEQLYDAALAAAVELADGLATGAAVRVVSDRTTRVAAQRGALEPVGDAGHSVVLPLRSGRRAFRAELVLAVVAPLAVAAREGLEALAAQVSLALESAAHVEELHRRAGEARFRSLVQHASDVIAIVDRDGAIRYLSPSVETIFGYRPEDLLGQPVAATVHPDDADSLAATLADVAGAPWKSAVLESRVRAADGSWRWCESNVVNLVEDPNVAGVVLTTRDVSERRQLEEQLRHQAFHDPLTGLANRALFSDRVEHALARRRDGDGGLAVVFVDLDDFKTVNDSLGHEVGDALLVTVARRIADSVRAGDTAARLGGDEFAVLIEDADDAAVRAVVDRILDALGQPAVVGGEELACSASLGVALGGADDSATVLLRNADVAMYAAKAAGKGRAELFSPAMHTAALTRLQLKADLQRALDRRELRLHYQPIVALDSGQITGFEALVRWHHPTRGLLEPAEFIALAEETGLILPLGAGVLASAGADGRRWQQAFPRSQPLGVGVNLSAKEFVDPRLTDSVADVLERTGLAPDSLVIELTESVLVADLDAAADRLAALRALRVQIALDDFGTGYSSLSYLHRFPVDYLKVDRSFVARLGGDEQGAALTRGIIRFAGTLGITVVAEGVETAAQAAALRALGCPLGQGYLLGPPVPAEAVPALLSGGGGQGREAIADSGGGRGGETP